MIKKLSILTVSMSLMACGSSVPSESDISKNINKSFEKCEIAEVKDIKKINGEEGNKDKLYFVDFNFKLKFKEAEGANQLSAKLEELGAKSKIFHEEKIEKLDELRKARQEVADREMQEKEQMLEKIRNRPIDPVDPGAHFRQVEYDKNKVNQEVGAKYFDIYRDMKEKEDALVNNPDLLKIDNEKHKIYVQLNQINADYKNKCLIVDKFIGKTFFISNVDLGNAYLGKEYNIEFKQMPMKKTENGWLFDL